VGDVGLFFAVDDADATSCDLKRKSVGFDTDLVDQEWLWRVAPDCSRE
jgi:hypothetical protein